MHSPGLGCNKGSLILYQLQKQQQEQVLGWPWTDQWGVLAGALGPCFAIGYGKAAPASDW